MENFINKLLIIKHIFGLLKQTEMKTYIIVNTKSNYENLNGVELEVKEFLGTLVAISHNGTTIDFNVKNEVVSIIQK